MFVESVNSFYLNRSEKADIDNWFYWMEFNVEMNYHSGFELAKT